MTQSDQVQSVRRLPRLRYSLKTLLIVSMLGSLLCGGFSTWRTRSHEQRRAIQQVIASGGWVKYEFEVDGSNGSNAPRGPRWLRDRLGIDYFNRVVQASVPADFESLKALPDLKDVEFVGGRVVGDQLTLLDDLPSLRVLRIRSTRMSKVGLDHLAKHENLEVVDFGSTKLKGVPLAALARMPALTDLGLAYTEVDKTELATLIGHINLTRLSLKDCDVSGPTMVAIGNLTGLTDLDLAFCRLTDADIKQITTLRNLEKLSLEGTAVSDVAIKSIAEPSKLRVLNLSGTRLSDAGFAEVSDQLGKLIMLNVSGTQISDESIDRLAALKSLLTLRVDAEITHEGEMELRKKVSPRTRIDGRSMMRW